MGYYDGNTVTAFWNYAQNYAMSGNFFDTEFGVTVEGHMNLLSGQTNGLNVVTGGTYTAATYAKTQAWMRERGLFEGPAPAVDYAACVAA